MARFKSTSCGTTLLKSKQPTVHSHRKKLNLWTSLWTYHSHRKKTKSLDLRSRPKVPPDARQKLALLRLRDVFRFSDSDVEQF